MMTSLKQLAALVMTGICAFAAAGCGYTFQGSGSILPQDVKRIYVPVVENSSTEPGLSTVLTESLRDQFDRFGVLTVVDDLNDADAVLKARILNVRRNTRTTTGGKTDTALQYDATMSVQAEIRRITGAVLWRNENLSVSKSFGTTSDVVVTGSADFAEGIISSSTLSSLDSREVGRGEQGQSLQVLADQVSQQIYDQAVTPDF